MMARVSITDHDGGEHSRAPAMQGSTFGLPSGV
jgi:hypothetical protein